MKSKSVWPPSCILNSVLAEFKLIINGWSSNKIDQSGIFIHCLDNISIFYNSITSFSLFSSFCLLGGMQASCPTCRRRYNRHVIGLLPGLAPAANAHVLAMRAVGPPPDPVFTVQQGGLGALAAHVVQ